MDAFAGLKFGQAVTIGFAQDRIPDDLQIMLASHINMARYNMTSGLQK
jgi:hypothetical protein